MLMNQVAFDEVVYSWLRDEWDGPKYDFLRDDVNLDLIFNPDLTNEIDNKNRYGLLFSIRRYLLSTIPSDTIWYSGEILNKDMKKIRHLGCFEWFEFTSKTFKIEESIKSVDSGHELDDGRVKKICEIISSAETPTLIGSAILVGKNFDSIFTILEGNHRLVAGFFHGRNKDPDTLISGKAYFGISSSVLS